MPQHLKKSLIAVSRACSTCKHDGLMPEREPCRTCGPDMVNWRESKPEYGLRTNEPKAAPIDSENPSGGAMLRGKNYYQVPVPEPMNPDLKPYMAECADIIEALGMTFNEGEAFKALWRGAAARTLGIVKNTAQYDADKAAHYGQRVAAQVRRGNPAKE